ncbi:coiled-coil-helix-coiled-coil-helix domain-containing protein 1 [Alligator sinensis]|uniref:Coiled-coil-helix-coiled-coil-helix domain-containing protein 1 n=1 Tax=Alligator sinensis TaxID=38654 RepID=A0A1U7RNZ2_ALLSI|nr:coiled-coil-helix-coiled-coil-helix domain-containing protein 1 [Alligator sinensis]
MQPPGVHAWAAHLGCHKRPPRVRPSHPLVLANRVQERRQEQRERPCVTEMMGLMSCWKKNEFNSDLCTGEFQAFRACLAAAEKQFMKQQSMEYIHDLSPKQVNRLLRRFPNITHEI